MTRLILILLIIFIVLTVLKRFIQRVRINKSSQNKPHKNQSIDNDKNKKNDSDIVDAKFEEIK